MKKVLLYFLSYIILTGCAGSGKDQYTIVGSVTIHDYENEWVYLIPLKGATAETVDSIKVKKGKFRFEGEVENPEIRILRMRPIMKFKLQELLVVVERGTLNVNLDSVSYAHGTPQNDILQQWKEEKMKSDSMILSLSKQKKIESAPAELDSIENEQEQIRALFNDYNYNLVKATGFNTVGTFIYDTFGRAFTDLQKDSLDNLKN